MVVDAMAPQLVPKLVIFWSALPGYHEWEWSPGLLPVFAVMIAMLPEGLTTTRIGFALETTSTTTVQMEKLQADFRARTLILVTSAPAELVGGGARGG